MREANCSTPADLVSRIARLDVDVQRVSTDAFPAGQIGPCGHDDGCDQPTVAIIWPAHGPDVIDACADHAFDAAESAAVDAGPRPRDVAVEVFVLPALIRGAA